VSDYDDDYFAFIRIEKILDADPSGLPWEAYRTMENMELFSGQSDPVDGACCTPETMGKSDCCQPSDQTTGCCD
jgi:hypothetical protein